MNPFFDDTAPPRGPLSFPHGARFRDYPERDEPRPGWVEQGAVPLLGMLARWRGRLHLRDGGFVRQVIREGRELKNLDEQALSGRITTLRAELRSGRRDQSPIARAFALVREVADRCVGQRHFDVQIMGARIILQGMVAEMMTGEGKTLTATLPACTVALAGFPVHIVTVNDYLATRDAEAMLPIYTRLGLRVGIITEGMDPVGRRAAYACDITYCTNKQLVFDYLRDHLLLGNTTQHLRLRAELVHDPNARLKQALLPGLYYAIVDETDSVLIDEARTPLIISGPKDQNTVDMTRTYAQALELAGCLEPGTDYRVMTRDRMIELTGHGQTRIIEMTGQFDALWMGERHCEELVRQALSAEHLFKRDQHYLIKDGKVQIIDEYTGRTMADRSWERGLHQLVEIKEGCEATEQRQPLARISYQRFFRRYLRLAGMSGTAREVAGELWSVYGLATVRVPPNRPPRTEPRGTAILQSNDEKWDMAVSGIRRLHARGQPVLVGTRSVKASEEISERLAVAGLEHRVLNARQDEEESSVISLAGQPGHITVATNMAGRGTDIRLGAGVEELGGLHVMLTEYHEARRIDRQLFGRCGRQGDPGSYETIVAMDDELIHVFCPRALARLGHLVLSLEGTLPRWVGRRIFHLAQRRAEREHARARRELLKMDTRMNDMLAFSGRGE